MKITNKKLPILLATCFLAAANSAVHAGPQSVLDPYFMVPAPKNSEEAAENRDPKIKKQKKKEAKKSAKADKKEREFVFESSGPPVSDVKFGDDKSPKDVKFAPTKSEAVSDTAKKAPVSATKPVVQPKPQPKESKAKSLTVSDRPSFREGAKQIGSGIVESTKATGYDLVDGSKLVSKGVVSGTKSAYNGIKWSGEKIATGASATKDKLAQAHQDGFKESMANAGSSVKNMTIACGSKIWDGTKWVGHGCETATLKSLDGAQWLAQKTGDGAEAAKNKLADMFGGGAPSSPALASTENDPTKSVK